MIIYINHLMYTFSEYIIFVIFNLFLICCLFQLYLWKSNFIYVQSNILSVLYFTCLVLKFF